jgi:hypothetical protein
MLSSARSNNNEHIPCRIAREAMTVLFLMLQSKRTAREHATAIIHCKMQGRNNQILHMLLIARMTAMSALVVLHKAMTMIVDCGKGTQDRATQPPTKCLCRIEEASKDRETTTSSTR